MIKYIWHAAGVLIVFCLIENAQARSAAISSYQHLNGFTVTAPINANSADVSSEKDKFVANDATWLSQNSGGIWKDLSLVYRIYQQCSSENLSVCLKVKLLTGLEKVLRTSKSLRVFDGVQFVRSSQEAPQETKESAMPSEKDIEATLPRSLEAKEHVLNNMIVKKIAGFLKDHTLQVKFPNAQSTDGSSINSVEGREKKKDKKGGYIMIPLLLGGTFIPLAYGALAMLAGKALIVSKLALVLASIIGIKKLLSGGGGGKESHEVVVQSGGHSGWGRDFDLAYNGWRPAKDAEKVQ